MSSPTDIPGIPSGGGAVTPGGGDDSSDESGGGIRNDAVRAAVAAFAADPGAETVVDVLRNCLFGPLLLDVTGSDIALNDDGEIAEGSTIEVRGGQGPDDKPALFAFTSHTELARMYEGADDEVQTQSLVQDAAGVLEMCRAQETAWLFIDPAGPACALAVEDIDFALRVPRNDAVRAALEPGGSRESLLAALHADGPLSLGVDPADESADDQPDGGEPEETQVRVRATDAPDGSGPALVAFTSGPEVVARSSDAQVATQTAEQVLTLVRDGGFAGLLLNPAGPWAYVSAEELAAYRSA